MKGFFVFVKDSQITVKENPAPEWFMRTEYGCYQLVGVGRNLKTNEVSVVAPTSPPYSTLICRDLVVPAASPPTAEGQPIDPLAPPGEQTRKIGYLEYLEPLKPVLTPVDGPIIIDTPAPVTPDGLIETPIVDPQP